MSQNDNTETTEDRTGPTRRQALGGLAGAGLLAMLGGTASADVGGGPEGSEIAHLRSAWHQGSMSERPDPGVERRIWYVDDEADAEYGQVFVDDGSTWNKLDLGVGSLDAKSAGIRHLYPNDNDIGSVINALDYLQDGDASGIFDAVNQAFTDLDGDTGEGVVVVPRKPSGGPYDPSTQLTLPRNDNIRLIGLGARIASSSLTGPWITDEAYPGAKPEQCVIDGFKFLANSVTMTEPLIHLRDWGATTIRSHFLNAEAGGVKISSPNSTTSSVTIKNGSKFTNVTDAIQIGNSSDSSGTNNNRVEDGVKISNPNVSGGTAVTIENGFRNEVEAFIQSADVGWDVHTDDNYIGGHFDGTGSASTSLKVRNGSTVEVDVNHRGSGLDDYLDKWEYTGPIESLRTPKRPDRFPVVLREEFMGNPDDTVFDPSGTGSESTTFSKKLQVQSGSSSSDERELEPSGRLFAGLDEAGIDYRFISPQDSTQARYRVGLWASSADHILVEANHGSSTANWNVVVTHSGTTNSTDTGRSGDTVLDPVRFRVEPANNQVRAYIQDSEYTLDATNLSGSIRPYIAVKTNESAAKTLQINKVVARAEYDA